MDRLFSLERQHVVELPLPTPPHPKCPKFSKVKVQTIGQPNPNENGYSSKRPVGGAASLECKQSDASVLQWWRRT